MLTACKICSHIRGVFSNPYHYTGAIMARIAVCIATIVWSVIVLIKSDALVRWPGASWVTQYIGEDSLAWGVLVLALLGLYRVVYQAKPVRLGACIYCSMALLWVYTFASLALAIYHGETTLRPGQG